MIKTTTTLVQGRFMKRCPSCQHHSFWFMYIDHIINCRLRKEGGSREPSFMYDTAPLIALVLGIGLSAFIQIKFFGGF